MLDQFDEDELKKSDFRAPGYNIESRGNSVIWRKRSTKASKQRGKKGKGNTLEFRC